MDVPPAARCGMGRADVRGGTHQRRLLPFEIPTPRQRLFQAIPKLRILFPHARCLFPKCVPLLTDVEEVAEQAYIVCLELLDDFSLAEAGLLKLFEEPSRVSIHGVGVLRRRCCSIVCVFFARERVTAIRGIRRGRNGAAC